MKIALTIAGSDASGGAGIQADLKTFQALGVFGMSAVTAVTVQNTQKVYAVEEISPAIVRDQILRLYEDTPIDAVKIGMVSSIPLIESIAEALEQASPVNVVLDPVMISKSGYSLLNEDARTALVELLFPLADVVTPNIHEAQALIGENIDTTEAMAEAARDIARLGARRVMLKGGHLGGPHATDIVFDGQEVRHFSSNRIATQNTHGTGCTLSAAIAAHLAREMDFFTAVAEAKHFITGAIENALKIGKGHGPTQHFWDLYTRAGLNLS